MARLMARGRPVGWQPVHAPIYMYQICTHTTTYPGTCTHHVAAERAYRGHSVSAGAVERAVGLTLPKLGRLNLVVRG